MAQQDQSSFSLEVFWHLFSERKTKIRNCLDVQEPGAELASRVANF